MPSPYKTPKSRNLDKFFNNAWQIYRQRNIQNVNTVRSLKESGFPVIGINDFLTSSAVTSHLPLPARYLYSAPSYQTCPIELSLDDAIGPASTALAFHMFSSFPRGNQVDHALAMTKSLEVVDEVFGSLQPSSAAQVERYKDFVKEACYTDSTQHKLARNFAPTYIGYNPVIDKLRKPLPYDAKISWQHRLPRDFGISRTRRNHNICRRLLREFDLTSLLDRQRTNAVPEVGIVENTGIRQFFERSGRTCLIQLPIAFALTANHLNRPFAPQDDVISTSTTELNDISPMYWMAGMYPKEVRGNNVAVDDNWFPILQKQVVKLKLSDWLGSDQDAKNASCLHVPVQMPTKATVDHRFTEQTSSVLSAISLDNRQYPWWTLDFFATRAMVSAFGLAIGQFRLLYGPIRWDDPTFLDKSDTILTENPIVINFVFSNGNQYHFSQFQLNTLDLRSDDGIKNFFRHDRLLHSAFNVCEFVDGLPQLDGFDPSIFDMLKEHIWPHQSEILLTTNDVRKQAEGVA